MEDARLIVSELFTNAVNAAPGVTAALYLHYEGGELCLGVWDPSAQEPVMGVLDPEEESGQGLYIVEALSLRHGHYRDRTAPGKVVWATLKVPGQAWPPGSRDAAGRRAATAAVETARPPGAGVPRRHADLHEAPAAVMAPEDRIPQVRGSARL
jgi:hypothetical protein